MNHVECGIRLAEANAVAARATADLAAAVERVAGLRATLGEVEDARDEWMARAQLAEAAIAATVTVAPDEWRIDREEIVRYEFDTAEHAVQAPRLVSVWWARRGREEAGPFPTTWAAIKFAQSRGRVLPSMVAAVIGDECDRATEAQLAVADRVAEQLAEDRARGVL